jgi:hypothetical protein
MDRQRFDRLHGECRRIIGALRQRRAFPASDCDDLEQVMAQTLLEMDGHTDSYCLGRAAWDALKWLRSMYGGLTARAVGGLDELARLADGGGCKRVWC